MYPARCPNPSCQHPFTADRLGSVDCPACGTAAVVALDSGATADASPGPDITASTTRPARAGPGSTVAAPSAASASRFGTMEGAVTVGRFRLRDKLGSGAFGDVYRAYDPQLDRDVALKVAKPGTLDSPDRVGRFLREARAAANLRHPNIVPVFDSGRDGDRHYIATGFVEGRTLAAEIESADGGPLDPRRAAVVARKLAEALGYAHGQGIVHRDVKPANVLVGTDGEPSLADFGLALREGDEAVKTTDGAVMGTPAYMSPEQAAGKSAEATAASDQYALGVMLYEMVTGRRPFDGPVEQVLVQQVNAEPPRPRTANPTVPRDLETVVLKCLEKNPLKRYPTCEALAEDLRRFLAGEPVTARRVGPVERFARWARRNPVVASSVSFGVLALLLGMVVSIAQRDDARWQAKLAKDAAADAADKKQLADDKAAEALGEKARADEKTAEALGEKKRANDKAAEAARLAVTEAAANKLAQEREKEAARERARAEAAGHAITLEATYAAWTRGDAAEARRLLSHIPPRFQERWETEHLRLLLAEKGAPANGKQESATWENPKSPAVSLAVSSDSRRVAVGGADGRVTVWDADAGKVAGAFQAHPSAVAALAYSTDGRLATAGLEEVRVWGADAHAGAQPKPLRDFDRQRSDGATKLDVPTAFESVAFSRDGRRVVAGGRITVRAWDLETGEQLFTERDRVGQGGWGRVGPADRETIVAVGFFPAGDRVFFARRDRFAGFWDWKAGGNAVRVGEWEGRTSHFGTETIPAAALSPDGTVLALAVDMHTGGPAQVPDDEPTVRLYATDTGRRVLTLRGHTGAVTGVAYSADGSRVVTASADGTAAVWDAETGRRLVVLKGHAKEVRRACFDPAGRRVYTLGSDGTVKVWTGEFSRLRAVVRAHRNGVHTVQPAPGGRLVSAGFGDLHVWSPDGEIERTLAASEPRTVRFSADGRRMAFPDPLGRIVVWDTENWKVLRELASGNRNPDRAADISPDGRRVVVTFGREMRAPEVIEVDTGTVVARADVGPGGAARDEVARFARDVRFAPDGTTFATVHPFIHSFTVWDAATGKRRFGAPGSPDGGVTEYLADGKHFCADTGESLVLYDLTTGKVVRTLDTGPAPPPHLGKRQPVAAVYLHQKENLLAAVGADLRVYDLATGKQVELAELGLAPNKTVPPAQLVRFTADGRRVVCGTADGRLVTYDARPGLTRPATPKP